MQTVCSVMERNQGMRQKTYLTVIAYIKQLMQDGKLTFGQRLPSEREMMNTLKMGRNSIREALRTLENMGVVESRQGQGNFLVNRIGKSLNNVISMLVFMRESNDLEISQLRRGMEIEAFALAVLRCTEEEKKQMKKILDQMREKAPGQGTFLDKSFHKAMVCASGNHLLLVMSEALEGLCEAEISHALENMGEEEWRKLIDIHEEIFTCLDQRQTAKGIEALQRHYDQIDRLFERISE